MKSTINQANEAERILREITGIDTPRNTGELVISKDGLTRESIQDSAKKCNR